MTDNNNLIDKIDNLLDFDGITLAVWGINPHTASNFSVSFDITASCIFELLSFTEEEYTNGTYDVTDDDMFILSSFYDVLMNFSDCRVKFITDEAVNLYVPYKTSNVRLCLRLVNHDYAIMEYRKIVLREGSKAARVGIFNYDTLDYDDFPKDFEPKNPKYYSFM